MEIRNFLKQNLVPEQIHEGKGLCPHAGVYRESDFDTPIRFLNYSVLPEGATFGLHTHGDDNELYIVLSGSGIYTMNGEEAPVEAGDILVNKPFATHGIQNTGKGEMRLLVLEVYNPKPASED